MSFWGLALESGKRYAQKVETSFHVSMAALDCRTSGDNSEVSVIASVGKNDYLLCTLSKQRVPQQPLQLIFQAGENIAFTAKGKGNVHLTGYLEPEDDFSMLPSDEEEEVEAYAEDEETSIVSTPGREKKRKGIDLQVVKADAKKPKYLTSQLDETNEEEEDEEDSDYNEEAGEEEAESGEEEEMDEEDESGDEDEDSLIDEEEDSGSESDDESEDEVEEESVLQLTPKSKKQLRREKQEKAKTPNKTPLVNGTPSQQQSAKKKENLEKGQTPKGEKVDKGQTPKGQKGKDDKGQTPKGQKTKDDKGQTPKAQTPKDKSAQTPKSPAESPQKKTLQGGVQVEDIVVGTGPPAKTGKMVGVYYVGRLRNNNKMFDSSTTGPGFRFRLGAADVIKGWDIGVQGMKVGGKRRIVCPPHMAYGDKGSPPAIPPRSWLSFEVELKSVS